MAANSCCYLVKSQCIAVVVLVRFACSCIYICVCGGVRCCVGALLLIAICALQLLHATSARCQFRAATERQLAGWQRWHAHWLSKYRSGPQLDLPLLFYYSVCCFCVRLQTKNLLYFLLHELLPLSHCWFSGLLHPKVLACKCSALRDEGHNEGSPCACLCAGMCVVL